MGQRETLHSDDGRHDESVANLRRAIHPLGDLPGVHLPQSWTSPWS
ncbi:hypothetical protein ACFP3U_28195 [Kitasatospora misakiensis]|uniref:Uncharacterized protein n=1 Tax=Kitasatospora misakiensis TaxID=67330 RepID=A0ABW0XFE6_9ACTN